MECSTSFNTSTGRAKMPGWSLLLKTGLRFMQDTCLTDYPSLNWSLGQKWAKHFDLKKSAMAVLLSCKRAGNLIREPAECPWEVWAQLRIRNVEMVQVHQLLPAALKRLSVHQMHAGMGKQCARWVHCSTTRHGVELTLHLLIVHTIECMNESRNW